MNLYLIIFILKIWEQRNVEFLGQDYVSFNPVITFFFEKSLSNGTEEDEITIPNIPAIVRLNI